MSPHFRISIERLEDRLAPAASNADPGLRFLADMHDEFHTRLDVSTDVSAAGNHFVAVGFLPDENAPVVVNGSSVLHPHSGATEIRNEFRIESNKPFGGAYFMNGLLTADGKTMPNFGDVAGAGYPIPAPTRITFWARGQVGGERLEFFAFGVGRHADTGLPFTPGLTPDSSPRVPGLGTVTTLTADWQQYVIDLPAGTDTSYVLGGFAWTAEAARNPTGAVFYLDDIAYELSPAGQKARLAEPRFVRSYRTGPNQEVSGSPVGDFDFVLRNSAFSYDNALAALAFLADRDPASRDDSLRRARLIGDAFVYAAGHDRAYTDGRVRTDYAAGDYRLFPGWRANGRLDTVPVAGFYDEAGKIDPEPKFYEVEQEAVDTGNNAWVMVALLGLYSRTTHQPYLDAARRVGEFIRTQRYDTGAYPGFRGGIMNAESPTPTARAYASTEHNLDITAAFTRMFELTGEAVWRDDAAHAWRFVESMWDAGRGVFLAGTSDPNTRNTTAGQLPLDVQAWAVLVRPDVLITHPQLLAGIDTFFRVTEAGITGYDFNEDRDGVWTEGTAQVATAFAFAGRPDRAADLRAQLDLVRATVTAPGADGRGLPAALHDGLTTGFQTPRGDPFLYHNRLHTGATAWGVFARLGFNPYYQSYTTDPLAVGGEATGTGRVFVETAAGHFYDAPVAAVTPFGSPTVPVRTAIGDVNGDRVPDTVLVTGPGVPIRFAVVSGRDDATLLVKPFDPFGGNFTGGGFVAAADLDGDGRAEVVVTPDQGGGPRVSVFALNPDGSLTTRANFFGIDDANFRGGARAALGDVNRDGTPDLAVAAGFLGGPRTALFDGATLFATPARLVGDFFAFPGSDAVSLRNGVFVASGDVDGDGFADLIFGGGPGGAPRVFVLSGALVSANNVAGAQAAPVANFFVANNSADRGGVRVAATTADGDGRADVAAGSGEGSPARVRVYLGMDFAGGGEPAAFQDLTPFGGAVLADGVYVG